LLNDLSRTMVNVITGSGPANTTDRPLRVEVLFADSAYARYRLAEIEVLFFHKLEDTAQFITLAADHLTLAQLDSLHEAGQDFSPKLPFTLRATPWVLRIFELETANRQILLLPRQHYSQQLARTSQRRLQELNVFRNAVFRFYPVDSTQTLRVRVLLTMLNRFSFRAGAESFQTENVRLNSNLPGVGANLSLTKRNAFRHAERFNLGLNGSIRFFRTQPDAQGIRTLRTFYSYGVQTGLVFPRLLFVGNRTANWRRLFSSTTNLGLDLNYENPGDYERTSLTADYSYNWQHTLTSPHWSSQLTALNMALVNSRTSPEFNAAIEATAGGDATTLEFVQRDFRPRVNSRSAYYLQYNNQYSQRRDRLTTYFRTGGEIGGNLPFLYDWLTNIANIGDGSLADARIGESMTYGQFFKGQAEGKAFAPFGKHTELVGRIFVGYAHGWNFTKVIPFENRFFAGGTNSVRGWQANTLGPGTFPPTTNSLIGFGGEYKFEANLEYRRDVADPLELALFLDAGNVWFSSNGGFDDTRGRLSTETFRLGVAGGLGIRVDLDFLVVRLDLGQQLYAPDLGRNVVNTWSDIGNRRFQYNLAIGYPF
jgi:outer membrane protein assembly factor BamA